MAYPKANEPGTLRISALLATMLTDRIHELGLGPAHLMFGLPAAPGRLPCPAHVPQPAGSRPAKQRVHRSKGSHGAAG